MADTGLRFDEQTNAGPSGGGASLGASVVCHGMRVPYTVSRGGTVDLPGCGRPRSVASNPKAGEAGAYSPWKSRGRSLPLVPAVPAARFPQPHSASLSSLSIIGNDLCRARKSCAGQRGPDDHEGMTNAPRIRLNEALDLSEQPGPLQICRRKTRISARSTPERPVQLEQEAKMKRNTE